MIFKSTYIFLFLSLSLSLISGTANNWAFQTALTISASWCLLGSAVMRMGGNTFALETRCWPLLFFKLIFQENVLWVAITKLRCQQELENLYEIFHTRLSIHRRACQHKIKMAVEIMWVPTVPFLILHKILLYLQLCPWSHMFGHYISRIRDALLLVDDHPDFQMKNSEGTMVSLSKAKDDMESYIKLTGSGFNLCCGKIIHSVYFR